MLERTEALWAVVPVVLLVVAWNRRQGVEWRVTAARAALAGSICLILAVTLFPLALGANGWRPGFFHPANLTPFATIRRELTPRHSQGFDMLDQLIGNVLLFVPLGLTLPIATRWGRRPWRVVAAGLLLSVAIELTQVFLPSHQPDVDDVILNTLGTALGFAIYAAVTAIRRPRRPPRPRATL